MKRNIVIGAETEYGCFVVEHDTSENDVREQNNAYFIESMLDEGIELFSDAYEGAREAIEGWEEHQRIEEDARRDRGREGEHRRLRRLRDARARAQRRGYSGLMLPNGARFYRDMDHPEYSIPESADPREALIAQRAGDVIVERCRRAVEDDLQRRGEPVRIYVDRTNSDGRGHSYAGHENYSLSPRVFNKITSKYEALTHITALFFIVRQLVTGSGKFCSEVGSPVSFQISQRADFIMHLMSTDTISHRGIINLRDIPYGDYDDIRRLHVIVGDSNMSEVSLFLKFGISALFFMMLEESFLENRDSSLFVPLKNAIYEYQAVSRDLALSHRLEFVGGSTATALELLYQFAGHARSFVELYAMEPVWYEVVSMWEQALEGLSGNRRKHEIARSLDWVVKERVASRYHEDKRLIDLNYHSINTDEGVFYGLERRGSIKRLTREDEIHDALKAPPETTRAWARSEIIRRYRDSIDCLRWNVITFSSMGEITLPNPYGAGKADVGHLFEGDPDLEEFLVRVMKTDEQNIRYHPTHRVDDFLRRAKGLLRDIVVKLPRDKG